MLTSVLRTLLFPDAFQMSTRRMTLHVWTLPAAGFLGKLICVCFHHTVSPAQVNEERMRDVVLHRNRFTTRASVNGSSQLPVRCLSVFRICSTASCEHSEGIPLNWVFQCTLCIPSEFHDFSWKWTPDIEALLSFLHSREDGVPRRTSTWTPPCDVHFNTVCTVLGMLCEACSSRWNDSCAHGVDALQATGTTRTSRGEQTMSGHSNEEDVRGESGLSTPSRMPGSMPRLLAPFMEQMGDGVTALLTSSAPSVS